jgi:hypothetical protein
MKNFTQQQLFQVRNTIDIDWLINEKLNLRRQFNRIWRFQCPLCQQFNTATQKKNNLARCFSCQKNFNTIDLVIYTKQINFIPSVTFLLTLCNNIKSKNSVINKSTHYPDPIKLKEYKKVGFKNIEKLKQILQQ